MKLRVTKEAQDEGHAERARAWAAEGHSILAVELQPSAGNIKGVAATIEAIEGEGWRLEHAPVYWNTSGINTRNVVLIFRRVEPSAGAPPD